MVAEAPEIATAVADREEVIFRPGIRRREPGRGVGETGARSDAGLKPAASPDVSPVAAVAAVWG